MEERNTLGWPSIEQLPRSICSRINRFFQVADLAATAIQRYHRGQPSPLTDSKTLRGGNRQSLHHWCLSIPVTAGEKYDGTNVGKLRGGILLGRRLVIEPTATSYQRCDLTSLRNLDVDVALSDLIAMAGIDVVPQRAAIYGELMCNGGLYHYQASGLAKSWQAFGALIECENDEAAAAYAKGASVSGLVCCLGGERTVRICNNEAFGEVLRRHHVPAIATLSFGSLCEAVASQRAWMTSERGEGLVLSLQKTHGKASTYKWKISREPQPAAVTELAELLEELTNGADGKAVLVDRPIHDMIGHLYSVTTHVDSTTLAPPPATKQQKAAKQAVVDQGAIMLAISSALTKFDALETTFESEGKRALNQLTERLCAEVLSDGDLALPTGGGDKEAAEREVNNSVKRHIGQAYGVWLKGQQGSRA